MTEPNPRLLHADILTEITRKERRNLLIASMIGICVAELGLVPTRFSALGIELTAPAQRQFVLIVAALVCYFLAAFLIYALPDLFAWWKKYQQYLIQLTSYEQSFSREDQDECDELHKSIPKMIWLQKGAVPVAFLLVVFEFVLPLTLGAISVLSLKAS